MGKKECSRTWVRNSSLSLTNLFPPMALSKSSVSFLLLFLSIFPSVYSQTTQALAKAFAANGQYQQAIQTIDLVITNHPYVASYYIDKVNYQIGLQNYPTAVSTLTEAIRLMPDSIKLYESRGTLLEIL